MKKTLLFVLMCVCATVSAWAQGYSTQTGTWNSPTVDALPSESVITITISEPGSLATAIASLNNYQIVKIVGEINDADISALSNLTVATIDLQDAYKSDYSAFTFTNSSVRNLILPDNWTKDEVNAIASASGMTNLGSAYSYGTFKDADGSNFDSSSSFYNKGAITAYVKTGKTLRDVLIRSYGTGSNSKFGNFDSNNLQWTNIYGVSISGNAVAQDIFKDKKDFTADGHLVFDREANEKERNKANDVRQIVGTGDPNKIPAFYADGLGTSNQCVISLDLSGVIIEDTHNSDLTLSESGLIGADTRQVCIPTYSGFNTIPADFLYVDGNGIHQICIPGNIKYIKTRAFHRTRLDHVWTTGTTENMKYDNGIFIASGNDEVEHDGQLSFNNATNYLYGTYTLPEGLKLIESSAFCYEQDAKIKDVYSLAIETPECHVDAFSTINYHGNNTFNNSGISAEGIITRDAYIRGDLSTRHYITMLHFPRECGTPYVQRYTDPTRDYSIATGDVDGNGSPIYFPNQCEFDRAYNQGTTGYLWNAWDPTRDDNGSGKFSNTTIDSYNVFGTWDETNQAQANGVYADNATTPAETLQFTSFYDVTADGLYNQPQSPTALVPYYNVYRGGGALHDGNTTGSYTQLYPQAVTETVVDELGNPVYQTVQVRDGNGNLVYEEVTDPNATWEGNYVPYEVEEYFEAEDGGFYRPMLNRNYDSNKPKPWYKKENTQVPDPDGEYIWTSSIGDQYNYTLCSTWLTWGHSEAELAQKRSSGWTFRIKERYVQDNNNGDYYLGDYTEYTNGAEGFVSGLSGPYKRETVTKYREATSEDSGPFWKIKTEEVEVKKVIKANDYRGWHQFVLTGYAHNSELNFEPLKSYISDNDWWTICAPYDLRRSDLILLFGDKNNPQNLPYLSKLVYVVRDVEKGKITLMFSKNLMVYKEYEEVNGEKKSINDATDLQKPGTHVHGIVDDTEWTAAEIAQDPIILHRGVPYLIKPYMSKDSNGKFNRQFDIYSENQPTNLVVPTGAIVNEWLYQSFKTARSLDGDTQKMLIYDGEYQVPAYVINNSDDVESTISEITIKMNLNGVADQGPSFTYSESSSDDPFIFKGASYPDAGKELDKMMVSNKFRYTFVGTFYKSLMPEFSYFLGWNKNLNGGKGGAAFYYNRVVNTRDYNWNNETGIICANWSLTHTIEAAKATDLIPAQWKSAGSGMENDDYPTTTSTQNPAKSYMDMEFGNSMSVIYKEEMGIATRVQDIPSSVVGDGIVYDIHGVKMGTSLHGLAKGVYVVNGKKYVVK